MTDSVQSRPGTRAHRPSIAANRDSRPCLPSPVPVTSARAGHDKSHVPRLDALAGDVRTLRRPRHREVGRVIRTVQLLRFLSDPQLRARTTAATNKAESYNNFAAWCRFGNGGVIA